MDLPPWFKIENLIGNLDLSGWFGGWFKQKNIKQVDKEINIKKIEIYQKNIQIISPLKIDVASKIAITDEVPSREIETKEFEFTDEEKYLISKVNEVHTLCSKPDFNFESDYRSALHHIRNKPSPKDWFYSAAMHISQAMQDIDFFDAFEGRDNPESINSFDFLRKEIEYIYNRLIQELRHTNKRGQVEKQFKGAYHVILDKAPKITDHNYEEIFNVFQDLLIKLFQKYKLKDK